MVSEHLMDLHVGIRGRVIAGSMSKWGTGLSVFWGFHIVPSSIPVSKGWYLLLFVCLLVSCFPHFKTISTQDLESKVPSLSSSSVRNEMLHRS